MESQLLLLIPAGLSLAIGAITGWFLTSRLLQAKILEALEQGRNESAVALATLTERKLATEAELSKLRVEEEELEAQTHKLREELNAARDEGAKLTERSSRIPSLEARIHETEETLNLVREEAANLRETCGSLTTELKEKMDALTQMQANWQNEQGKHTQAQEKFNLLSRENAELRTRIKTEEEKHSLLLEAKEALSNQFKSLANDIFEEKSKRFTDQNQANLGQLLNPLKERMTEFKAKVEEIHSKDTEQQAVLKTELAQLKELNRQMTEEAHSLATALKGQAKKQGNWGELILSNVLERSGLCEGKDFKREVSFTTEDGRKRPDVIIYLPQKKHLIIDAKVSLNAYTRYVNAEDDLERKQALQEHAHAVANRIQELSNRAYFELPGLNTPELVFMFIPIESAFVEALRADENLFQQAIEKNVLVATPTTLLSSLNIVRQLWRFEEQNAHTAELASHAAKVYHKLSGFLESMESVGIKLDQAKESFGKARGQLCSGKGNLIKLANDFKNLGVSVKSSLPESLLATASLELEHLSGAIEEDKRAI